MKDLVNDGFARVVKPYIDAQNKKDREIVAPVEVSPAEAAHIVGDQIIFDGILYDVSAQIAVGDSLATTGAGANISAADNIETQIKDQKTQLQSLKVQNKNTQEMLASVEEDETGASRAYAIGEQLILDGILYNVTAQIAVGDPLATTGAGANISAADNIETQINEQKTQLQSLKEQNENIQEMLAPVEEDETDASRAYAIGEQLILNGILYNVIDSIAQHGIISAQGTGANIEAADPITQQIEDKVGTVQLETTGTASATTTRYQRLVVDGTPAGAIAGSTYLEQSVTLSTSADVTTTFNNSAITANSAIDVYTTIPTLTYKDMNISAGSCTVTFDKQDTASTITVRIYIK